MFRIICLAGFVGALIALGLIFLFYLKGKSIVLPYIVFFVFIAVFGASAFLHITGVGETADDPAPNQPALTDPSEEPSSENTDSPPQESDSDSEPTLVPTQTPATPAPASNSLSIGDSAALGDWDILVTDFYFADKIEYGDYFYYSPDAGTQYAIASVRVTNNGTEADTFLPSYSLNSDVRAKVYYDDKYTYDATTLLGVTEDLHNTSMNPLTSKTGIIVFSVPDEVVGGQGSLSLALSAGQDEITFSLR